MCRSFVLLAFRLRICIQYQIRRQFHSNGWRHVCIQGLQQSWGKSLSTVDLLVLIRGYLSDHSIRLTGRKNPITSISWFFNDDNRVYLPRNCGLDLGRWLARWCRFPRFCWKWDRSFGWGSVGLYRSRNSWASPWNGEESKRQEKCIRAVRN